MKMFGVICGVLCLFGTSIAADTTAVENDLEALQAAINVAKEDVSHYKGGMLLKMAQLRLETLRLSEALLEQVLLAEKHGVPIEQKLSVRPVDEEALDSIVADLNAAQSELSDAKSEAEVTGGLIGKMALLRVATINQQIALLKLAAYRAAYGIEIPVVSQTANLSSAPDIESKAQGPEADPGKPKAIPSWADPEHPEINYDNTVFMPFAEDGQIHGWWAIKSERAAIDDSPRVIATNLSYIAKKGSTFSDRRMLAVRCSEGETSVVYFLDTYLLSDHERPGVKVSYRIEKNDAVTSRWSRTTERNAVGLFGADAKKLIRALLGARNLFLRAYGREGKLYDVKFDLAGFKHIASEVSDACGWHLTASVESLENMSTVDKKKEEQETPIESGAQNLENKSIQEKNNDTEKWQVDISTNPVDDTKKVVMWLTADSGEARWANNVSLVIRCQSNKTEMYINWQGYLGSDELAILTRIGDSRALSKAWNISTDKKASFYPGGTIPFLKRMMEADTFVAQVTPYNESPVTAVFDIKGMKDAIKPLADTCNWSPDTSIASKAPFAEPVDLPLSTRSIDLSQWFNEEFLVMADGEVCEDSSGYLRTTDNNVLPSLDWSIKSLNSKRKVAYKKIALKYGISVDEIARQTGQKVTSSQPQFACEAIQETQTGVAQPENDDRAALVKEVQLRLEVMGFNPGPADGIPGEKTVRAVKDFQHKNNVAVDGKIDISLLEILKRTPNSEWRPEHTAYDNECATGKTKEDRRSCAILTRKIRLLSQGSDISNRAIECYDEHKPNLNVT